jgi:hypothetical protein
MRSDGANGSGEVGGGEGLGEGLLARVRETYNPPPEPPLDAMWGRIEEDRLGGRGAAENRPRRTGRGRGSWWLGMTAALVVGVALGRVSTGSEIGGQTGSHTVLSIAKSEESSAGSQRSTAQVTPCDTQPARAAQ